MSYELYEYPNPSGTGMITALTSQGGCGFASASEVIGFPRLWIHLGWVYQTGVAPEIRGQSIKMGASSSKLVTHELKDSEGLSIGFRFIVIESSSGGWIKSLDDTLLQSVDEGDYVDVILNRQGGVVSITTPQSFDPGTTPGSVTVMTQIQSAKQSAGIG